MKRILIIYCRTKKFCMMRWEEHVTRVWNLYKYLVGEMQDTTLDLDGQITLKLN
jgi:hypothetical protein